MLNNLEKIYKNSKGGEAFFAGYTVYLGELAAKINFKVLTSIADLFLTTRDKNGTIFFVGNGGSATTASHFTQDIGDVGRKAGVSGFKTFGLTDNVSILTAVANDHGYDEAFCTCMEPHFVPDDVFVGISASGNSKNVVNAAKLAKAVGGKTVALVGFSGGQLSKISDYTIHIETSQGEYGPVEDLHLVINHMLVSYLTLKLMSEKEIPPVMPLR